MLNQPRPDFPEFSFPVVPVAGYSPPADWDATDSGLTCHGSRKRGRNSTTNQIYTRVPAYEHGDVMRFELDSIISQHTKRIRSELDERRRRQARFLVAALGEGVTRKLKEKDEQIQRMERLNIALQNRVSSMYEENQLWRELAQSNEATVNSLRANLEHLLSHEEEVGSCCESNDEIVEGKGCWYGERMCRMCGEREACVLVLPCRHLCLCGGCGSRRLQACPVCDASMNATLHVNMS